MIGVGIGIGIIQVSIFVFILIGLNLMNSAKTLLYVRTYSNKIIQLFLILIRDFLSFIVHAFFLFFIPNCYWLEQPTGFNFWFLNSGR